MKPRAPLLAAVLLAALSCDGGSAMPGEEPELEGALERREPTKVRTAEVVRKEMVRTLITSREVESENQIDVLPRAQGVITELHVEEGDAVEVGQVLAVLDQREARAAVDDARIGLEEARDTVEKARIAKQEAEAALAGRLVAREQAARDYERNEKARLISGQALDALRLERDTAISSHEQAKLALDRATVEARAANTAITRAELALERAELTLSFTEITAPIAGVIARRMIKVGDTVSSGAAAFTITDHENLIVVFPRPQRELPLFQRETALSPDRGDGTRGLEIHATTEALPGARFRGEILRISPSIDPENGSFRVTARLQQPPAGARLLPGMLVRLEIVTDRHPEALVVPKRALRREGDLDLIFVVADERARRVEVEEGFSNDDEVEVVPRAADALEPGDLVVVVGNRDLEEGSEVETTREDAPTGEPGAPNTAEESPGAADTETGTDEDA